jgi:pentapeptide MXKDX repeat protein
MKLVRVLFVMLAVAVPSSWTIAHAGDDMKKDEMGDKGGEMKKGKKKGDMDKGNMDKGAMDKKKGETGK